MVDKAVVIVIMSDPIEALNIALDGLSEEAGILVFVRTNGSVGESVNGLEFLIQFTNDFRLVQLLKKAESIVFPREFLEKKKIQQVHI